MPLTGNPESHILPVGCAAHRALRRFHKMDGRAAIHIIQGILCMLPSGQRLLKAPIWRRM